jgi:uncharacterized membrane protein
MGYASYVEERNEFPVSAGILLGVGLGGFFDGIVLHQVLQWHHMVTSAGYPANSVVNLELNTLLDGLFHAATWLFTVAGLFILWRRARHVPIDWNAKYLCSTFLIGFGLFNLVEGLIDHQILGLHHVNESAPPEHWIYWDIGFLIWGAAMLFGGWLMLRSARRATADKLATEGPSRPAGPVHLASRRG